MGGERPRNTTCKYLLTRILTHSCMHLQALTQACPPHCPSTTIDSRECHSTIYGITKWNTLSKQHTLHSEDYKGYLVKDYSETTIDEHSL